MAMGMCVSWSVWGMEQSELSLKEQYELVSLVENLQQENQNLVHQINNLQQQQIPQQQPQIQGQNVPQQIPQQQNKGQILQTNFNTMKILLRELIKQFTDSGAKLLDNSYVTSVQEKIVAAFGNNGLQYSDPHDNNTNKVIKLKTLVFPELNKGQNYRDYCAFYGLFYQSNVHMVNLFSSTNLLPQGQQNLYKELIKFKATIANKLKTVVGGGDKFDIELSPIMASEKKSVSWMTKMYDFIHNTVHAFPATLRDNDMKNWCVLLKNKLDALDRKDMNEAQAEQHCYIALYILVLRQLRYFVANYKTYSESVFGHAKTWGTIGLLGLSFLGGRMVGTRFFGSGRTELQERQSSVVKPSIGGYRPSTGPTDKYLMFRKK